MKKKNLMFAVLICLLSLTNAFATTYYVAEEGCDDDTGTSWATAFETLTEALSNATSGDDIWVAAGTYTPGTTRSSTFQMVAGVDIYGGFDGTETALTERDLITNTTILSGDIGTIGTDTDNCYHVVTGGVSDASLNDLTVTKGYANSNAPDSYGAGLIEDTDVYNCIFEGNYASGAGGAAWLDNNCEISNCTFKDNSTDGNGGAVHLYGANVTFKNSLFHDNSAANGGGIYIDSSNPTISNCTIASNDATSGNGGGLYFIYCSSNVAVKNCIIWDNTATGSGAQIFKHQYCSLPSYSYCDIEDSNGSGTNWDTSIGSDGGYNIDEDPSFKDSEYHIDIDSPCIDAGDSNGSYTGQLDIDLEARVAGGIVDMGADEGVPVIYVDADASGNDDGSSWTDAYVYLQDALGAATTGNEIWVADGTYYPDEGASQTDDLRTETFQMIEGVDIYGGFDGTETAFGQRDYETNLTILSGDIDQTDVDDRANNSEHVVTGEDDAILDGFTVEEGDSNSPGGGLYNYGVSPTISHCIFSDNTPLREGGAIYNYNSSAEISDCTFTENRSSTGGAIYNGPLTYTIITDCAFIENRSSSVGGAIWNDETFATIDRCFFIENTATDTGGAIANGYEGEPEITNCVFYLNLAGDNGGAIYNYEDSEQTIINCTFAENITSLNDDGLSIYSDDSNSTIANCIFWNDSAPSYQILNDGTSFTTISYSDVQDCFDANDDWDPNLGFNGGGNIDEDPNFIDSTDPNGTNNELADDDDGLLINVGSPCVNAGDPNRDYTGQLDIKKDLRVIGINVDMGAYESLSVIYVDANASGNDHGSSWTDAFEYLQDALDTATAGNEIWVAAGTYYPDEGANQTDDSRTETFQMIEGVNIYGGFDRNETSFSERNGDPSLTILSGDIDQSDVNDRGNNSYHVVTGEDDAILDGLTVEEGNSDYSGAGLYNNGVSPTISHCIFRQNTPLRKGGAIYNYNSSPEISDCIFTENRSSAGGAIYNGPSTYPTITDCEFIENRSSSVGGAIWNDEAFATINNCFFIENTATDTGGAVANGYEGEPEFTNCVFYLNLAGDNGGAMYNYEDSEQTVINCTFAENMTSLNDDGLSIYSNDSNSTIANCIFWNDSAPSYQILNEGTSVTTISYSDVQDSNGSGVNWDTSLGTDGGGNIDIDPNFVDSTDPNGTNNKLRDLDDGLMLDSDSQCIDAADGDEAEPTDILGNSRYDDPNTTNTGTGDPNYVDMGAYEFHP